MVAGIDKFLTAQTARAMAARERRWVRDFASPQSYEKSVQPFRVQLSTIIGAVDERLPVDSLELVATLDVPALACETDLFTVQTVRWRVLKGVYAEGLWLQPKGKTLARVVALPDADQTPEQIAGIAPGLKPERQCARRLAEHGCEVLVPTLISRDDAHSGSELLQRYTNQPHREWIYRQAYELGRHIIGYEVQKVLAAVDFFLARNTDLARPNSDGGAPLKVGVAGYAEGGLVAFYAAALDTRIDAALVSGYFDSRQRLWEEPIYRNIFGLLRDFGDAEIATLIAPRLLIVEHSTVPPIAGPPRPRPGRAGAAPGKLVTPDYLSVEGEYDKARRLLHITEPSQTGQVTLICGTEGGPTGPLSDRAMIVFLNGLGIPGERCKPPDPAPPRIAARLPDPGERQKNQIRQLEEHTQRLFRESEQARAARFWNKIGAESPPDWARECKAFRQEFQDQVMGTFGPASVPLQPRARLILERRKWAGFEVVLEVYPDVFAWGYLLVPAGLQPGEQRPTIVCQHGLEGVPADVINEDPQSEAYRYYKAFGARLAERGFVVFVPHNPYRGGDKFRELQRKANPLGGSLFSIIIAQHDRALEWLSGLPFVDPSRIGFYGLSYGGKTAMRVPAVVQKYALSICSGDFNEWVRKNVSVDSPVSYMFTGEYEMPEWNLGHTFNYAEMAALIAPRPFMVERGHSDGVGLDEWVAYEFAKVRRLYDRLGIPDRTSIEYFNGPHTIHGVGTFEFLERHLGKPGDGGR
jgi:dienelactone hydrolase